MSGAINHRIVRSLEPRIARLLRSSRMTKRLLVGASDSVTCVVAAWISFAIRLGDLHIFTAPFAVFTSVALGTVLIVFIGRRIYNNIFRFHGPKGLAQIARGCLIVFIVLVVPFGLFSLPGVPRTVSVLFPAIFFILVATNRIVARFILVEMLAGGESPQKVLIYGAGIPARQLASSLHLQSGLRLVAFASEDSNLAGQTLEGSPILGADDVGLQLARGAFDVVVLALDNVSRTERATIVEWLQTYDVRVQTVPGIHEIVSGEVSFSDLREIDIADLLSRDPVQSEPGLMGKAIAGQTVLVTGAGGSIGSELCRQIVRLRPARLVLFEMTEASLFEIENEVRAIASSEGIGTELIAELGTLVNQGAVERLFARWAPDTVFHAAAYKHVPMVETNPVAGVHNNVLGTLYCAQAAVRANVRRFVLVSTDKAVRPTNVMGASKRVCELILQGLAGSAGGPIFAIVRFGNVLGSSGSVVPLFRRQIEDGGPVTLTHGEVTRFFMTIPEAAELVIQAGAMARGGEVFLLDMGEPLKIHDLARSMILLSGRSVRDGANPDGDIEIVEIGLRPGEKLYEELLINAEAMPTDHPRIFRAHEFSLDWEALSIALQSISEAVAAADYCRIRELLGNLVAGFESDRVGQPQSAETCEDDTGARGLKAAD